MSKSQKAGLYMVDLFSGAGGLSVGLEQAGFKSVLAIDNDKSSIKTYKQNHKDADVILGDIKKVKNEDILKIVKNRKIKLVCGGPPCQGFSTVGKNDPKDSRNHLFMDFVRIVELLKPDYLLVENVTGLLSRSNENTLQSIIKAFRKLGYYIDVKVLSAHHYGVAETRRRTIILGNKFGVKNIYPDKKFKNSISDQSELLDPHSIKWAFEEFNLSNTKKELKDAQIKNDIEKKRIKYIPEGKGVRYKIDEDKYLPKNLKFNIKWSEISEGRFRQTKLKRLSFSEPSPTINTYKATYYHPKENRYLTVSEAAAIQSFPGNFRFEGSNTQQWMQIGNAVPPLLAYHLGKSILKLDNIKDTLDKQEHKDNLSEIRKKAFIYREYKSKANQLSIEA